MADMKNILIDGWKSAQKECNDLIRTADFEGFARAGGKRTAYSNLLKKIYGFKKSTDLMLLILIKCLRRSKNSGKS